MQLHNFNVLRVCVPDSVQLSLYRTRIGFIYRTILYHTLSVTEIGKLCYVTCIAPKSKILVHRLFKSNTYIIAVNS